MRMRMRKKERERTIRFILAFLALVNCLTLSVSKGPRVLPIDIGFNLPSSIPTWPPGEGFANGTIDLGGLQVRQISTFNKIWATVYGGDYNLGASVFEPSPVPKGFFTLGYYSQPNTKRLYGWVLVGKDSDPTSGALKEPIDYLLLWNSASLKIKQDGYAYIWLPIPPDGYKAVGHVVTNSPVKPSLDKIRCLRSDFTDQCETDTWIWGDPSIGFNLYSLRPSNRGTQAMGVPVGSFVAHIHNGTVGAGTPITSIACLKNTKSNLSAMPNLKQIEALVQAYSPVVFFHPHETFLPSSVGWFFINGAQLFKKEEEWKPVAVYPTGLNLPQGGSNDGAYWLDLPLDKGAKEKTKKGDLFNSEAYIHTKPMLGATFTDIAVWVFYPFNGPARIKVEFIDVSLERIGEHVGDWEHVTLRVSNFNGELRSVYFSQHGGGTWISAQELEFQNGNKPVTYASLHGHAMYPKPGLVLQGSGNTGMRNDAARSQMVMDTGAMFSIFAAEYLGSAITEPIWLNYFREWGPEITYDIEDEIKKVERLLPKQLKSSFQKFMKGLPPEVLGAEGPTGPKIKRNWSGDEA